MRIAHHHEASHTKLSVVKVEFRGRDAGSRDREDAEDVVEVIVGEEIRDSLRN